MFDQYIIKYFASVVALLVYAAPVYLNNKSRSLEESTQDYIRAMRLLQNTSKCAINPNMNLGDNRHVSCGGSLVIRQKYFGPFKKTLLHSYGTQDLCFAFMQN
jgi:hypothetical protein